MQSVSAKVMPRSFNIIWKFINRCAFGITARLDFEMFIIGYVLIEERSMKSTVLAPKTCAKVCRKARTAGDRSIKYFRAGCFKMHVCKLRHNLNILITRDSEVLSTH